MASKAKIATPTMVRDYARTLPQFDGDVALIPGKQGRLNPAHIKAFNDDHKGKWHYSDQVKPVATISVPVPSVNAKGVFRTDKRNLPQPLVRETLMLVQDGKGARGRIKPDALTNVGAALAFTL